MRFDKNWLDKRWVAYTIAACAAVVLYLLLSHLGTIGGGLKAFVGILKPVLYGIVIAYVMEPLVKIFQKYVFGRMNNTMLNRLMSVFCAVVAVVVFIVILMVALVPQLIGSIATFINNMGKYITSLQLLVTQLSSTASESNFDIHSVTDTINNLLQTLNSSMPTTVNRIVNTSYSIGMNVFNLVVAFILAVYFLADKSRVMANVKRLLHALLPPKGYSRLSKFCNRCHHILVQYIGCDILDALIVGAANYIFFKIVGMPYAVLIAVICGVTNLAPTFGPIVGGVIGTFILVLVNPWYALWFIIFTFILQLADGYVIKPKLFGNTFGVSSLWILIAIIVGGRMFGVWGILLAIPVAAILDFVYHEYILSLLEEGNIFKKNKTS